MFGLPLRKSLGLVQSLLKLAQPDWPVPDFSTLSRRQANLQVQLSYRPSVGPLNLPVDSTGIKFIGEGEWKRKKRGTEYRRQWRKVPLGIDEGTLETPGHRGDGQQRGRRADAARNAQADRYERAHS